MSEGGPIPAAQYLRMSTEGQAYSLQYQSEALGAYAEAHGYSLVRTYKDSARSGLGLKGRTGLQRLLGDVLKPDRPFDAVLVFDVSRWGRFQDLDQGAHYEFLCRAAGVRVVYCAEPFEPHRGAEALLMKQLKRHMAAEFSRELSAKTVAAQLLQARLGHRQGAPLVYGVQRVLVNRHGRPVRVLERGMWKAQPDHHVVLRPGPAHELAVVRRIFRWFLEPGATSASIARGLNDAGVPYIGARLWDGDSLARLLRNELMIGVYLYNRTSQILEGPKVRNPPHTWVRVQVFDPIVPPRLFARAQAKQRRRYHRWTRTDLLAALQKVLDNEGRLSAALVKASADAPCVGVYAKHFGRLSAAYAALGYEPRRKLPVGRAALSPNG